MPTEGTVLEVRAELWYVAQDLAKAVSWFVDREFGIHNPSIKPPTGDLLRRARRLGMNIDYPDSRGPAVRRQRPER